MNFRPETDLEITRVIKAPRQLVWQAWTNPDQFAQWWIPAPALCRVVKMEVQPGGALLTEMSEGGGAFGPHMDACYLAVEEGHKIVLTNALSGGWRPATSPFMTAVITLDDHDQGTAYRAHVLHKDEETRAWHEEMGFFDGWGTVAAQLAALVER
ncbi:SRPBCC family protein [Devosia riboflavina]